MIKPAMKAAITRAIGPEYQIAEISALTKGAIKIVIEPVTASGEFGGSYRNKRK